VGGAATTPAPFAGARTGHAEVNGIRLYYAVIGHGPPVLLDGDHDEAVKREHTEYIAAIVASP
jgi:hypothetical protein